MIDEKNVLTVTQLNLILKNLLEETFREIYVEGEVSNFKEYSSGHWYFSLKDENSQIQCIIFRDITKNFKFKINNGMKIICYGRIDLYLPRGEHRFIIYDVIPKGIGALQLAFEQLKKKLELEGLFDEKRKRKIPFLPQKIGVITSPDGAAIRDILSVIRRRFANVEILLYPVKVQGDGAAEEIANGIKFLNTNFPEIEVILLGRGGGSIEDLWAFNEEIVARAVVGSKIPIISCVGHEIDYTITDYVADLRAPTPSAAAELVVKNKDEILDKLRNYKTRLVQSVKQCVNEYFYKLKELLRSKIFVNPLILFEDKEQYITDLENRLNIFIKHFLENKFHKIELLKQKLKLLSPGNILSRGYAIVWLGNKILKNKNDAKLNDEIKVQLFNGDIIAEVKDIN
jgi:exodeoxyribonuclease VII large subunit